MARPKSDIGPRIVHAARRRFLEDGVDGASLRRIAREARTNIGMIYYYFPTKDDLFLAVVEEIYDKLIVELEAALAQKGSFAERVLAMYRRLGAMSADEAQVFLLIAREALVSSARLERVIERFKRGHIPLVLRTLMDGVASGEVHARCHPSVMMLSTLTLGVVPQMVLRISGDPLP
jgi:TetR/AcrR family transcriptional repressor of nem operon